MRCLSRCGRVSSGLTWRWVDVQPAASEPRTLSAVVGQPQVVVDAVADVLGADERTDLLIAVNPSDEHWRAIKVDGRPALLLHTGALSDAQIVNAVANGTRGFLSLHDLDRATLIDALELVAAGDVIFDQSQQGALARDVQSVHNVSITLSHREAEILHLVEAGQSVKQTARQLGISPKTVENTQRHLFRKLGVRNRAQAVARSYALGLLSEAG
jgi:DNA-binding NarL/FixJ family response regulator